jgi:hypothetical protein
MITQCLISSNACIAYVEYMHYSLLGLFRNAYSVTFYVMQALYALRALHVMLARIYLCYHTAMPAFHEMLEMQALRPGRRRALIVV